jgi:phosphate transport system permease protein
MTITAPPGVPLTGRSDDDVPITLRRTPTTADRVFRLVLGASSAVVLLLLAATTVFLIVRGWPALHKAGLSFFTSIYWSPDHGRFGVLPLLVGSWAIALVGLAVAFPISVAMALMINEYSPARLRPYLISFVDILATVPSIVYGLWGYELFSSWQAGPAGWIDHHFAFVPILRSPSPVGFGFSILATGLVCALTIIPIITSIVREVMGQVPRDVCEAALGLGGTKWGMITDVILPFSRNGMVGGALLGFGRGLGETMIPVLVLSTANKLTAALAGPGGLGSIAKQIAQDFEVGSSIDKSALIMAGLTLFVTTLAVSAVARGAVRKAGVRVR